MSTLSITLFLVILVLILAGNVCHILNLVVWPTNVAPTPTCTSVIEHSIACRRSWVWRLLGELRKQFPSTFCHDDWQIKQIPPVHYFLSTIFIYFYKINVQGTMLLMCIHFMYIACCLPWLHSRYYYLLASSFVYK